MIWWSSLTSDNHDQHRRKGKHIVIEKKEMNKYVKNISADHTYKYYVYL